jgi:hypothetical protein
VKSGYILVKNKDTGFENYYTNVVLGEVSNTWRGYSKSTKQACLFHICLTGKFYASAKRCSISSVFTEDVEKTLIGKQLPGTIQRVECEAYEYIVEKTGETMLLPHTYTYVPEEGLPQSAKSPATVGAQ